MTTLGQLAAATLNRPITFWSALLFLAALLLIVGPRYIKAYADLVRARRDGRQSDEDWPGDRL